MPRSITDGESERPSSWCKPRLLIPSLFLSPGGWGQPETRSKNPPSASCWASWVDFLPFPSVLRKRLRKNIEKNAKIKNFGLPKPSPNPPKTPSKSMFQKTSIFSKFFATVFVYLLSWKPWKYQFSLGKTTIFKVFAKNVFLQFSCIFGPKNLPKTLPKRSPNDEKIDVKNVLFFNIDFLGFRPRFWSLLGLQLGAKLAKNRNFPHRGLTFFTFWSWRSFENSVLEGSGLDFKGPGLDFGSPRPRF